MTDNSLDRQIGDMLKAGLEESSPIPFELGTKRIPKSDGKAWFRRWSRVAAAFLFLSLLGVTCTVPITQEDQIGMTVSGFFDFENPNDVMDEINVLVADQPGKWRLTWGMIRDLETNKPHIGTITIVLPETNSSQANELANKLSAMAAVSEVDVQDITLEVRRPIVTSVLPQAYRRSDWIATITFSEDVSDEDVESAIQQHVDNLARQGVNITMIKTSAEETQIDMSSETLETFTPSGESVLNSLGESLAAETETPLVLGSIVWGKMHPDSSNQFAYNLNLRHREIFEDRPGFTSYGIVPDKSGAYRYLTFYFGLPGTSALEADVIAERVSTLSGVIETGVNELRFGDGAK